MKRSISALLIGLMAMGIALTPEAHANKGSKPDRNKVYFGNRNNYKTPGVVNITTILEKIPEYKEAKKAKGARKTILQAKASKKAHRAIAKAAKSLKMDLVGEKGFIKAKKKGTTPPDITKTVIKKLADKK